MTFRAGLFRGALWLLPCVLLSGCFPSGSGPLEEEKEPHFLAGKSRVSTLDHKGAIECFEKALQVNPQSASAHFELACIFDQKESDPDSAIYHYDQYLRLQPKAGKADLARQRLAACKQAVAQTVSLGPVTDRMQRQFEQLTEENKRLIDENKQLHAQLEKWSIYAARLQTLTNPTAAAPDMVARAAQSNAVAQTAEPIPTHSSPAVTGGVAANSQVTARMHTVKAGETPILIAKRYGVKLAALMAANPDLDPRRLRVGQVLRIPGA